jgi:hypothetical protein
VNVPEEVAANVQVVADTQSRPSTQAQREAQRLEIERMLLQGILLDDA